MANENSSTVVNVSMVVVAVALAAFACLGAIFVGAYVGTNASGAYAADNTPPAAVDTGDTPRFKVGHFRVYADIIELKSHSKAFAVFISENGGIAVIEVERENAEESK